MTSPSAFTARRPSLRMRGLALLALGLTALSLAGCAIIEGPTPTTPVREAPSVPEVAPALVPGGTADENLPYFTEVIRAYTEGDGVIKGEPVAKHVVEAGFDQAAMQVSFDRSKTGLEADNIFVSVLLGEGCLVGQLVTADRSFAAEALPAVGPENNICLIGNTAPISW